MYPLRAPLTTCPPIQNPPPHPCAPQARRNQHRGRSVVSEDRLLVYNWRPQFSGRHESEDEQLSFEQVYIFTKEQWRRHAAGGGAALAADGATAGSADGSGAADAGQA